MALPSSGTITLSQVAVELGRASNATTSLGETAVRNLAGVPSGAISLSNLWGKSNITPTGYTCYGYTTTYATDIASLLFSTETPSVLSSTFSGASNLVNQAGANSASTGYCLSGVNALTYGGFLWSIAFSTNTTSYIGNIMGSHSTGIATNSSSAAYLASGLAAGSSYTNAINKLTFSTQTASLISAVLTYSTSQFAEVRTDSYGYFAGGRNSSTYYNTIAKLNFSAETTSSVGATLAVARAGLTACYSTTKGYFFGGYSGGTNYTEIDGIQFSTDTSINPSAVLGGNATGAQSMVASTKGYQWNGGTTGAYAFTTTTTIRSFTYSTESSAAISATSSAGRYSTYSGCQSGVL